MKALYQKYERHISTVAFVAGFIFDNFALRQIDKWFVHLVLLSYLILAAVAVIIFNAFDTERERVSLFGRTAAKFIAWFPVGIQFSLGTILSGSLVFYSRSASLSVSWPFIALLVSLIVCNELIHDKYARLTLQISSLFVAAFLYASFSVPLILKNVGVLSFLTSGLVSLVFIFIIISLVAWISPERFKKGRVRVWMSIFFLYSGFQVLYFSNLIPPLPLSLGEIGIYHSVTRSSSLDYVLRYEKAPWYYFGEISPTFHVVSGETAYAFSSIVAPSRLEAPVVHEWFFRGNTGNWVSAGVIPFTIVGGREEGYRGYSAKSVFPGDWRVEVKTIEGRLIGRTTFTVISATNEVGLETLLR